MTIPHSPPPEGLSLPIHWRRVIDGDTLEVILPSGRSVKFRIEGFDAPGLSTEDGRAAKHALESLLEETSEAKLTAFFPLTSVDRYRNDLLGAMDFVRAYLFAGSIRVDFWMGEHGFAE